MMMICLAIILDAIYGIHVIKNRIKEKVLKTDIGKISILLVVFVIVYVLYINTW